MSWSRDAACRIASPEIFFDPLREEDAKVICRVCPVRRECAAEALEMGYMFGVWGAMGEKERKRVRRQIANGRVIVEWT